MRFELTIFDDDDTPKECHYWLNEELLYGLATEFYEKKIKPPPNTDFDRAIAEVRPRLNSDRYRDGFKDGFCEGYERGRE